MGKVTKLGKVAEYTDGRPVELFRIEDDKRPGYIEVMNYGCVIHSAYVPDKDGNLVDVLCGYRTYQEYIDKHTIFSTIIGRVANRTDFGKFTLDGKEYQLTVRGKHHLHGGLSGFNQKLWDAEIDGDAVVFTYVSPDGEEGYPGTLTTHVRYTFSDGELLLDYSFVSDANTIVNYTNHAFWNLNGEGSGTTLDHKLYINASKYCECNEELLLSGVTPDVAGTPYDFTMSHAIRDHIKDDFPQLVVAHGGYDVCFALDKENGVMDVAAELIGDKTGIKMTVLTTYPAMQLYNGGGLGFMNPDGKNNGKYESMDGVCLETQQFPNAINLPMFPSTKVEKDIVYTTQTIYKFSV